MKAFVTTALILLTVACAGKAPPTTREPHAAPVSDRQFGLSKASVFDAPLPDPVVEITADPGEQPAVPPVYPGAPPVIPHAVADFVPITSDSNACIDCHLTEEKIEGEPTPIPRSHFTDLRNSPDRRAGDVVGARYDCVECHAKRTEAAPLVDNRF